MFDFFARKRMKYSVEEVKEKVNRVICENKTKIQQLCGIEYPERILFLESYDSYYAKYNSYLDIVSINVTKYSKFLTDNDLDIMSEGATLTLINSIAHELRHRWQHRYLSEYFLDEDRELPYKERWAEMDARRFAIVVACRSSSKYLLSPSNMEDELENYLAQREAGTKASLFLYK